MLAFREAWNAIVTADDLAAMIEQAEWTKKNTRCGSAAKRPLKENPRRPVKDDAANKSGDDGSKRLSLDSLSGSAVHHYPVSCQALMPHPKTYTLYESASQRDRPLTYCSPQTYKFELYLWSCVT